MKLIEGELTRVGSSTSNQSETIFSIVEIGNQVLSKVLCRTTLANYLYTALEHDGPTKLYIYSVGGTKYIVGIELSDGKKYAVKPTKISLIMLLVLGLLTIGIYIWIIFFILAFFELKDYLSTLSAIKSNGAIILE